MNLIDLTLAEAAPLLRERTISPVELTRAYLERIERLNPLLNAYITVTADLALDAAKQAEAEILRGEYRGMLHGIPIALKDNIETAGVRTTAGSSFLRDYVPTEDAQVVKQLKYSGAILLGKTNLHEWAFGVINNNPWYGDTRNPWDTTRITGGSSGGSAAAVAAKMCLAALGTDTRGSVRIPAALCGVVGYKPYRWDRPDYLSGVIPLSHTLDAVGVFARNVGDLKLVYGNCWEPDGLDVEQLTSDVDLSRFADTGLRHHTHPPRVLVPGDSFFGDITQEYRNALRAGIDACIRLGAEVVEEDLSSLRKLWEASRIVVSCDAAAFHQKNLSENPDGFGKDVLERLNEGINLRGIDYSNAKKTISSLSENLSPTWNKADVLLLPTVPFPAPEHGDSEGVKSARARYSSFTAPLNVLDLPAITLPIGIGASKMPVSIQMVIMRRYGYGRVERLEMAHVLENALQHDGRLPEL